MNQSRATALFVIPTTVGPIVFAARTAGVFLASESGLSAALCCIVTPDVFVSAFEASLLEHPAKRTAPTTNELRIAAFTDFFICLFFW